MIRSIPMIVAIFMLLLSNSLSAQIFIDSTGSNGFGDLPHPLAKSRFSNTDHEYNLFVRTTGQDTTRGVGIYNFLDSGTSEKYGIWNHIEQAAGATGLTYGMRNVVSHGGDMDAYGLYTDLSNTADSKGRLFGTYSLLDDQGSRAQNKMYANFYGETVHRRKKNAYGSYLLVRSFSQDVTKNSYGQYIDIKGGGNATRYGVYSNINGGSGYAGYFVGDVHINGVLTQASDEKLKKNVKKIPNALEIVNQLTPHTYNYRAGDEMGFGDDERLHYGFVAQEVAKVLPDLVTEVHHTYTESVEVVVSAEVTDELGFPELEAAEDAGTKSVGADGAVGAKDIRGVRYLDMIALLVGAVQEQEDFINSQENEITELKEMMSELASKVSRLSEVLAKVYTCSPCVKNDDTQTVEESVVSIYRVYPNPASERITIEVLKPNTTRYLADIIDVVGKVVRTSHVSHVQEISTAGLKNGTYIVRLINPNTDQIFEKKLIINK